MSAKQVQAAPCGSCGGSAFTIAGAEPGRGGIASCVIRCGACGQIAETLRYRVLPAGLAGLVDRLRVLALSAADLHARRLLALKIHVKFKWVVPAAAALRRRGRPSREP